MDAGGATGKNLTRQLRGVRDADSSLIIGRAKLPKEPLRHDLPREFQDPM